MVRRVSPAFARNLPPIEAGLAPLLGGRRGRLLEIAAGPGQHANALAATLPDLEWVPTDLDADNVASCDAWTAHLGTPNVGRASVLDVRAIADWPAGPFTAVLAINFLHMVGPDDVGAFFAGASVALGQGGLLVVYDCFSFEGRHIAPSNRAFDAHLRNTTEGGRVHAYEDVDDVAYRCGFESPRLHWLPANNQLAVWTKS